MKKHGRIEVNTTLYILSFCVLGHGCVYDGHIVQKSVLILVIWPYCTAICCYTYFIQPLQLFSEANDLLTPISDVTRSQLNLVSSCININSPVVILFVVNKQTRIRYTLEKIYQISLMSIHVCYVHKHGHDPVNLCPCLFKQEYI